MKSGIDMGWNDPFGIDSPFAVVNPDCICGSKQNGTVGSECHDFASCKHQLLTQVDPFLGDPNCLDFNIEEYIDYTDTQLENIILSDFWIGQNNEAELLVEPPTEEASPIQEDDPLSQLVANTILEDHDHAYTAAPAAFDEFDVGNYVEVETTIAENEFAENEFAESISSPYYSSESSNSSGASSPASSTSTAITITPVKVTIKPSRSQKRSKRPKRIHDDRVKLQNKIAAIKYRKRKKEEQDEIDEQVRQEEEKNKALKNKVKEFKVQIKIIKELVGKYLQNKK